MPKKQATLKAFGFTRKLVHRDTVVEIDIPRFSEEVRLQCPECLKTFINKQGMSVHMKCVHGATSSVASMPSVSTTPSVPNTTTITTSSVPTTSSSETTDLQETSEDSSTQPKLKRRRIKHDATFKAEVIQLRKDGMSVSDLIEKYKSFNMTKLRSPNG